MRGLLRDLGQAQSTTGFEFVEEPSLFQQRERVVIGGTQQADDPGGFLGDQRDKWDFSLGPALGLCADSGW